jgi:hypothetical protein
MKAHFHPSRVTTHLLLSLVLLAASSITLRAQRYRTFSQYDLSEKSIRISQQIRTLTIANVNPDTMDGVRVRFVTPVVFIRDSSGFSDLAISGRSKILEARGQILPGRVLRFTYVHRTKDKRQPLNGYVSSANIASILFTRSGQPVAQYSYSEESVGYLLTAGNLRDLLYKRVLHTQTGLRMGVPDPGPTIGSVRYVSSDRRYFPHSGPPRCFSFSRAFRNPKVSKHDNHLLGELHALKLAIVGNDSGYIYPVNADPNNYSAAPLFGDLIYLDSANSADPANGRSIRQIGDLGDSALSFCSKYSTTFYSALDQSLSRINLAFRGELLSRFVDGQGILGARDISEVSFLHLPERFSNPHLPAFRRNPDSDEPVGFILDQNFPNPFNPSTVIGFHLPADGYVTLTIYSALGQEVATLLRNELLDEGRHEADFDAQDFPTGVYFYRLTVRGDIYGTGDAGTRTGRMMLVK